MDTKKSRYGGRNRSVHCLANDLGPVDSGVSLTATLQPINKMPGVNYATNSSNDKLTDKRIPQSADINQWFIECCALRETEKKSRKKWPDLSANLFRQFFTEALVGGVNFVV
jgi:hypothetical protein